MSKTTIAVKHLALGGRISFKLLKRVLNESHFQADQKTNNEQIEQEHPIIVAIIA